MNLVTVLLIFAVGFLAGRAWALRRAGLPVVARSRRGGPQVYHLNLDRDVPQLQPCKVVDTGVEIAGGQVVAQTLIDRVVEHGDLRVYLSAVHRVALAEQRVLQKSMKLVALHKIFSGGGDALFFLQVGACLVPIVVALWFWLAMSSMQNTVAQQSATLKLVYDVVSKPLVVAP